MSFERAYKEQIEALQRDNDALRKDNAHIEELYQKLADYVDKLSGPDEHSVFETIDNTVFRVESLKTKLAAAEAKCERLSQGLNKLVDATEDTLLTHPETSCCSLTRKYLTEARKLLSEPPSTSLTNYIREQTDEVAEALQPMVGFCGPWSDISWRVTKALAKLKQIKERAMTMRTGLYRHNKENRHHDLPAIHHILAATVPVRTTLIHDFSGLTDEQLLAKAKQLRDEWEGSLKEKASEGQNSSGHDEPHAS